MDKRTSPVPTKKILWSVLLSGVGIILFCGVQWGTYARPPLPEAVDALESDALVTVVDQPWLTFAPAEAEPQTGLIFYPGGRIDPQGYASLMYVIASESYLAVVPEMPVNMAVFDPNVADEIIAHYPQIERWVIGGHSVGGVMAAQYTNQNRENIDGLMIWAAYPAENADLSGADVPVISIYGSLDPRVNDISVAERKDLLPADTGYIRIEGGGHHQFGAYLIKPEEHQAAIPREEQHEQILQAALTLLAVVSGE